MISAGSIVPGGPGPLTEREWARLSRQIAGLRHIDAHDCNHARSEWDKGDFCRRVRDEGLWRKSPEHGAASFLDFVAQVCSLRSRSTVERRLVLVASYTKEEFLLCIAAGTCATALVEITRAEEELQEDLRALARGRLTVAEVVKLRSAGQAMLRARRKAPDARSVRDRLVSLLSAERTGQLERRRNDRGRPEVDAAPAPAPTSADAEERRLGALRRDLEAQARSLAAEKEALRSEAAAVKALRASPAAALADRDAQLDERESKLADREAQLAQLGARERALLPTEEEAQQLLVLKQQLADDRADLDFHRERLAVEQERIEEERAQLSKDRFQVLAWMQLQGQIEWPLPPRSIDETLLLIDEHLDEVVALAQLGREQCDKGRQLPEQGGIGLLFKLKARLKHTSEELSPLIRDVAVDYKARHPEKVARYLAEQDKAQIEGRVIPAMALARPETALPPREFSLPTAAILGTADATSPQHGVLGFTRDRQALLTLDMNGIQTVGIFGQQNAGKSHTILALTENALGTIPGVSITPAPMAVIHCHYGDGDSHGPGFGHFFQPNDEAGAVAVLRGDLQARPAALPARRRIVFVPPMDEAELQRRRAEYPGAEVQPLQLSVRELGIEGLRLLMGAGRGAPLYLMKINNVLSSLQDPTPDEFRRAIAGAKLSAQGRDIVDERLRLIDRLLGPEPLSGRIGPGDFVGLDMRAAWIDEGVAMALFLVAMNAFAQSKVKGKDSQGNEVEEPFRKMIVFDEAHRYMGKGMLSADILRRVREMRHLLMWVVYASQDPESVHPALIKLSSLLLVHQLKAKSSVKVLRDNFAGCDGLDAAELAHMARGEARVLCVDCADPRYRQAPQPVLIRPTCARPSGTTRPAVASK